jgi:hypothetical protein
MKNPKMAPKNSAEKRPKLIVCSASKIAEIREKFGVFVGKNGAKTMIFGEKIENLAENDETTTENGEKTTENGEKTTEIVEKYEKIGGKLQKMPENGVFFEKNPEKRGKNSLKFGEIEFFDDPKWEKCVFFLRIFLFSL